MRKFYPWYLAGQDLPPGELEALLTTPTLDAPWRAWTRSPRRRPPLESPREARLPFGAAAPRGRSRRKEPTRWTAK